ncbi:MAG: hypothetical protein GQ570_13295 [Helicobacteraceae bacterium]|nr:hypothetical protein [Helicobacteraceae bacterium]
MKTLKEYLLYNSMSRYVIDIHLALLLFIVVIYATAYIENELVTMIIRMWAMGVVMVYIIKALDFMFNGKAMVSETFEVPTKLYNRLKCIANEESTTVEDIGTIALDEYLAMMLSQRENRSDKCEVKEYE